MVRPAKVDRRIGDIGVAVSEGPVVVRNAGAVATGEGLSGGGLVRAELARGRRARAARTVALEVGVGGVGGGFRDESDGGQRESQQESLPSEHRQSPIRHWWIR